MFTANLVIPAQICDELSCGQGKVYGWTDRQMDRRRQRQYPFGLKGQGVKIKVIFGKAFLWLFDKFHAAIFQLSIQG